VLGNKVSMVRYKTWRNFLELRNVEVQLPRIHLPRTPVHEGKRGPGLLLLLVDPVDASVGVLEVAIAVVHFLDASDLPQKLASGLSQFL
jgi:hypothetical protein